MFGKKKKEEPAPEGGEGGQGAPEGEDGAVAKKKKMSGKKLVLFFVLPIVLVLGAGGGATFLLLGQGGGDAEQHADADAGHGKGKAKGKGKGAVVAGEPIPGPNGTTITYGEDVTFVALPEMLVNIVGPDGRPSYLKLKLTLEAPDEAALTALTEHVPRVSDQFNSFLRELRTEDLAGSAGAYRLRLELLRRVNLVIAPARVNAVLIEEMLVQ